MSSVSTALIGICVLIPILLGGVALSAPVCRVVELDTFTNISAQWNPPLNKYANGGCTKRRTVTCTAPFGRALVVYMLHTKKVRDIQPEFWNFNYFQKFGIYGEHQSTSMFSGVDYVFTRIKPRQPIPVEVSECAQRGNVRLLWLPRTPCDLCAHYRALVHLGGIEEIRAKYSFVVFMNAGTRGPFQHEHDAHWIDLFAMGGLPQLAKFDGEECNGLDGRPCVVSAPTLSVERRIHVQSNFLALHTWQRSFDIVYSQFGKSCGGNDKTYCGAAGELNTGALLLNGGVWLHSTARNVTLRNMSDVSALTDLGALYLPKGSSINPYGQPADVCAAVFYKHGGTFVQTVHETVAAAMAQLTLLQSASRELEGSNAMAMILRGNPQCKWLEIS